jgi:type I restriction enzyme M protein
MIDASQGFMKDGPKNRLREQDIHKIVDVFTRRLEVPRFSRMVSVDEIEKNDFNLNLPRYIDSQAPEDLQDIEGHLKGGIPVADIDALKPYWTVCPKLRKTLFKPNRPGYVDLAVQKNVIKPTIYDHPEFTAYITGMNNHFAAWRESTTVTLKALKSGCHPKQLIATLAEGLLEHYDGKPLIDPYDIYQHLMDYWAETMQDDCYQIAADGWKAETSRIIETKKSKDGKVIKKIDKGWTCDLVPKALLVARYYAKEQAEIDKLAADLESVTAKLAELEEEQLGDEDAFSEARADAEEGKVGKVTRATVTARLKQIKGDKDAKDEALILNEWLALSSEESDLKWQIKSDEGTLDAKLYFHYPKLTAAEVKALVVDDKWMASLDAAIHGEMDRVSQQLTQRVKELAERYETPLPQMTSRVAKLETKVNQHLEKMGFTWA